MKHCCVYSQNSLQAISQAIFFPIDQLYHWFHLRDPIKLKEVAQLQKKKKDQTNSMDIKLLICATEMRAISFSLCRGPGRRKEESQWSIEVSLSRSSWIPEELTGMYILECVSQPHLWGTHPPGLVSVIPLADLHHDWQVEELFGSGPRESGGRYGEFWEWTNSSIEISQSQAGLQWNKTHQWGVSSKVCEQSNSEGPLLREPTLTAWSLTSPLPSKDPRSWQTVKKDREGLFSLAGWLPPWRREWNFRKHLLQTSGTPL